MRKPAWGLMFDLGSTDGATASLVSRPLSWLRLHGGVGTNGVAVGIKGGAALYPLSRALPLTVEAGHCFPGDVNPIVRLLAGSEYDDNALFESFDYNFVNIHLGWQTEGAAWTFFVQGGASYVWTELNRVDEFIADVSRDVDASSSVSVQGDSSLRALIPSLKIGVIGFP